jgi:hypothetical protein
MPLELLSFKDNSQINIRFRLLFEHTQTDFCMLINFQNYVYLILIFNFKAIIFKTMH